MYKNQSTKLQIIKRTAVYSLMSVSAILITLFLLAVSLGYRFNRNSGTLEQNALIQFKSIPSGASVSVDGKLISATTPTKYGVTSKNHHFEISKNGYETWSKDLSAQSGTLYWFDYPILIPKNREAKQVASYQNIYFSLASTDGRYIILQKNETDNVFDLIDTKNDDITIKTIALPDSVMGFAGKDKAKYKVISWDSGNRFVLITSSVENKTYWIVVDTRSVDKSKNISIINKEDYKNMEFKDSSGNVFYALNSSGDLKRIDLNSSVGTKIIASRVEDINQYDNKWLFIKYKTQLNGVEYPSMGIYRDGDESVSTIYTSNKSEEVLAINGGNYKGTDYLALLKGNLLEIWNGSFPGFGDKLEDKMTKYDSMSALSPFTKLSFSPNSDYILIQFGSVFEYYYFEHSIKGSFSIPGQVAKVHWFNDDYVWSINQGNLNIREFDGSNVNSIMASMSDQAIVYTENGKYVYGFQKNDSGYGLYRIKMIVD